jgi:hypothetical protein
MGFEGLRKSSWLRVLGRPGGALFWPDACINP